jgi:cell division septum initiation protein DivIVA
LVIPFFSLEDKLITNEMNLDARSTGERNGKTKSGRVSDSSQAAKKRELDRLAQKKSRERARNRMLELEQKLERLQSDDKQKQIADLLRTVDELRKENERLRGMHQRVLSLVNGVGVSKEGRDFVLNVVFQVRC